MTTVCSSTRKAIVAGRRCADHPQAGLQVVVCATSSTSHFSMAAPGSSKVSSLFCCLRRRVYLHAAKSQCHRAWPSGYAAVQERVQREQGSALAGLPSYVSRPARILRLKVCLLSSSRTAPRHSELESGGHCCGQISTSAPGHLHVSSGPGDSDRISEHGRYPQVRSMTSLLLPTRPIRLLPCTRVTRAPSIALVSTPIQARIHSTTPKSRPLPRFSTALQAAMLALCRRPSSPTQHLRL